MFEGVLQGVLTVASRTGGWSICMAFSFVVMMMIDKNLIAAVANSTSDCVLT